MSLHDALRGPEQPPFAEPWQAQIFALTVSLNEGGVFTWSEWAETLAVALQGGVADGSDYYERWPAALEALLVSKNIAAAIQIEDMTAAWHLAAEATPHGRPILLGNDPEGHEAGQV